jgi:RHS repeat-associated protein
MLDLGTTYGAVVGYQYEDGTQRLTNVSLARERYDGFDLDVTYGYDAAGNITSVADTPNTTANALPAKHDIQCYQYDGLNRLQEAWTPVDNVASAPVGGVKAPECASVPTSPGGVNGAAPYWTTWSYDDAGNKAGNQKDITHREIVDGQLTTTATSFTYPATGTRNTGSGTGGPHALTTAKQTVTGPNGTTTQTSAYTYDAAGNTITRQTGNQPTQTLGWDAEGELQAVATTGDGAEGENSLDNDEAEFTYDASGERVVRVTAEGSTIYLPGGQELHVGQDGAKTATRYYSFAGQVVAVRTDRGLGGVASLVCDHHGTPLASVPNTDWTPNAVDKMYTTPYGAARGPSDSDTVPGDMGFLGKNRDEATGLTQVGARYYDEDLGRFISADPMLVLSDPAQWNAYAYGAHNPVNVADPSGLFGIKPIAPPPIAAPPQKPDPDPVVTVYPPVDLPEWAGEFVEGFVEEGVEVVTAIVHLVEVEWEYLQACMKSVGLNCGDLIDLNAKLFADSLNPLNAVMGIVNDAKEIYNEFTNGSKAKALGKLAYKVAEVLLTKGGGATALIALKRALPGKCSFEGDAPVLMGDGTAKPIEDIEVGDEVLATDPETGEQEAKAVEATHVHDDILITLVLAGGQTIRTTEDHPFWSATDQKFERADHLEEGEHVLEADGDLIEVARIHRDVSWEPAWNLTVQGVHSYHVMASSERGPPDLIGGTTDDAHPSVLVHNCGGEVGGHKTTCDCANGGTPVGPRNGRLAGSTHPVTGVPFDSQGFPDFSQWRHPTVEDVIIKPTGSRSRDFRAANKLAGLDKTPEGYTWNHHQDYGKMQLIEKGVHKDTGHTGGFSIWKIPGSN